jgi:hypothetical protein
MSVAQTYYLPPRAGVPEAFHGVHADDENVRATLRDVWGFAADCMGANAHHICDGSSRWIVDGRWLYRTTYWTGSMFKHIDRPGDLA